ncbi:Dynein heavy chain at 62B [Aphelenchoides bicaudatus]|nr:Dynein heavy chain at 62B [Aphelenchoides bicaudatus]
MYSIYLAEVKQLPVDLKISRIFRDKSDQVDVKLIQKCIDYTPFENSVVHQTCGQLIKLEKWKHEQGVDIVIGSSANLLLGTTIKEENRSATPCSDRRWKAEERVLLEDEFDENDCLPEIPPKLPDCELNEYPSWNSQINGIEYSAPDLMLVENDDLAMELMKEVEKYWLFWNSEYNTNFRSARVRELVANRQIYFDKKPSWLFDKEYTAAKQNISNTLLVHRMITNHFYGRIAPKLTYSWCQMMLEQEQMLIEDLALRMDAFLFEINYKLEISEMLLDNKECWIDVLLDDAEKEKFFNSIASLQAFLLRDVVYENIDGLMAELTSCKLNNPFYIKVELANSEVERHTVWDIVKRIVEIGTDVVRLECRLYPMSYPEERTFSILSSVIFEKFEVKKVEPFKESSEQLEQIKKDLEALPESTNKVDDALKLKKELHALERKTKLIRVIWCSQPYEFDFTNIKTQLMNTIRECIRTLNIEVTNFVYDQIKKIVDFYTISSQKLYGVDQLVQMYNLVFTRDEDFPKLKQMVNDLHSKFWKLSDEFLFTEITMQKYYQASRTTFRLAYLADLVWQKLLVDRHKIERQLADRATTMYYEGLMLEDNLKMLIKKYRTCTSYSDLKLIANKFQELAARASRISHDYPILLDQLQLFNMDIVKVNAESILKRVNIFAEVSTVHKMVFSFEEIFMNSRVADVHCADVNAEVSNLNQRFSEVNKIITEQEDVDDALKDSLDLLFAKISKLLDRYNRILPIVNALCGQGMRIHHWRRILCDPDLNENAKETLVVKDLLKIKFEGKEKCEEISNLANKELLLEGTLESMQKQWDEITVSHIKNPSTGVYEMEFKNEVVAFIEEQIIKTQMNISSPFSASMLPALKDWLHKLQRLQNIVDTYQKCLAKYTYLEPLFGAEDIAYQMPEEWRVFQEVNAKWKFLGEKLSRTTKFLELADVSIVDEQEFNYILETFQRIQRGFESYLQKRKLNFYRLFSFFTTNKLLSFRLYFLSNNELLEMLSRARNPGRDSTVPV